MLRKCRQISTAANNSVKTPAIMLLRQTILTYATLPLLPKDNRKRFTDNLRTTEEGSKGVLGS
jgi:hypothetical protein